MSDNEPDLRALLEAATPGPWEAFHHNERPDESIVTSDDDLSIALCEHEHEPQFVNADAALIAALRNEAAALLDDRDRLRALKTGVEAILAEIESPRVQRPGMQRRRLWASRLRALFATRPDDADALHAFDTDDEPT